MQLLRDIARAIHEIHFSNARTRLIYSVDYSFHETTSVEIDDSEIFSQTKGIGGSSYIWKFRDWEVSAYWSSKNAKYIGTSLTDPEQIDKDLLYLTMVLADDGSR